MAETVIAYIGLGSNLGDRADNICQARQQIEELAGVQKTRISSRIETAPLASADQPAYLNAVMEIYTNLSPDKLLAAMLDTEKKMGRKPHERWACRKIDLDLLLYGQAVIDEPELKVPHPQMHLRSFVLKGLIELAPGVVHPILNETAETLAGRLNGGDFFYDPARCQLVSLAGQIGVGKTTLAKKLARMLSADTVYEEYDENPFLPEVYAGKSELALDAQLHFLNSRLRQLTIHNLTEGKLVIADYIFEKELIYAKRLLSDRQLSLYRQIYDRLSESVVQPVLVLFLTDSMENCLLRIKKRSRPYEKNIGIEFLRRLDSGYQKLFETYCQSPLIRVNMPDFHPADYENIERLARQVLYYTAVSEDK